MRVIFSHSMDMLKINPLNQIIWSRGLKPLIKMRLLVIFHC